MSDTDKDTMDFQKVWNFDLGTLIRREELNGRQYIVVPMVMILEGVHVGSQGPVYYSLDELAKTPKQWNFKPIVIEHPFRGDTATDLEVYKKQAVGMIMNTHFVDGKLKAEAWIDEQLAQEKCPELIQHIEHRLPMEVSTGLFSELVMESGTWNGEEYKGKIINIRADHLAILPKKQGACSLSDGAGLLINQSYADKNKENGDTLNIISTVINQTFPPGTNVVLDYDLATEMGKKGEETSSNTKEQPEPDSNTNDEPKKSENKEKIENAIKPEVFMTSDGNKITYEASGNNTLEIEKPDFSSGEEKKEEPEEIKVEPIQDNPVNVEVTPRIGHSEFEELLADMAVKAERVQSLFDKYGGNVFNARITNGEDVPMGGSARKQNSMAVRVRDLDMLSRVDELEELEEGLVEAYAQYRKVYKNTLGEDLDVVNILDLKGDIDSIRKMKNAYAFWKDGLEKGNPGVSFDNDDVFTSMYLHIYKLRDKSASEWTKGEYNGLQNFKEYMSGVYDITDEELRALEDYVGFLYDYEHMIVYKSIELMRYMLNESRITDEDMARVEEMVDKEKVQNIGDLLAFEEESTDGNTNGGNNETVLDVNSTSPYDSKLIGHSGNDLDRPYAFTKKDEEGRTGIMLDCGKCIEDLLKSVSVICRSLAVFPREEVPELLEKLKYILDTYKLDYYWPRLRIMMNIYQKELDGGKGKKLNGSKIGV